MPSGAQEAMWCQAQNLGLLLSGSVLIRTSAFPAPAFLSAFYLTCGPGTQDGAQGLRPAECVLKPPQRPVSSPIAELPALGARVWVV